MYYFVRMEKTDSEESIQALRNLILLVGSLSTCGFVELKPNAKADCLYQMPGFTVPQPSGSGQCCPLTRCILHCRCVPRRQWSVLSTHSLYITLSLCA